MQRARILLFLAVIGIAGAPFEVGSVRAQTGHHADGELVQVATGSLWDPVWITKISIGSQFLLAPYGRNLELKPAQVMPGQRFTAGGDWLKEMTIDLMNRANEPLAWLDIALRFPERQNGRTEPGRIFNVRLGRMPDVDAFYGNGDQIPAARMGARPLDLQPGAILAVHVSDYADEIKASLEKAMPATEIQECYVSIAGAEFEDGLRYSGGGYSIPDSHRPGRWKYYPTRTYFPGDAHRYLPNIVRHPGQLSQH